MVDAIVSIQLLYISWAMLPKRPEDLSTRWRWLAMGAFALAACFGLVPVVLSLTDPGYLARGSVHPRPDFLMKVVSSVWPIVNVVCTMSVLLAHRDEAERELRRMATHDGLTGLLNRATVMALGEQRRAECLRKHQPFTALILDLDHFKNINDTHGHAVGDSVLKLFAELLRESVRARDLAGRYGGEEFCLFVCAGAEVVQAIDQRLRERLKSKSIETLGFEVSFSGGAIEYGGGEVSLDQLISTADQALYQAKRDGRGKLVVAASAELDRLAASALSAKV
jgi:diguanylate cyclase (GGDEF)-like protein